MPKFCKALEKVCKDYRHGHLGESHYDLVELETLKTGLFITVIVLKEINSQLAEVFCRELLLITVKGFDGIFP